jgi:hypothetical protein
LWRHFCNTLSPEPDKQRKCLFKFITLQSRKTIKRAKRLIGKYSRRIAHFGRVKARVEDELKEANEKEEKQSKLATEEEGKKERAEILVP